MGDSGGIGEEEAEEEGGRVCGTPQTRAGGVARAGREQPPVASLAVDQRLLRKRGGPVKGDSRRGISERTTEEMRVESRLHRESCGSRYHSGDGQVREILEMEVGVPPGTERRHVFQFVL